MLGKTPVPRQYWLLLAFSILVPLAVFLIASWANRNDEMRAAAETVERTVTILDQHAQRVFDTGELVLATMATYTRPLSWDDIKKPETSRFLRDLASRMPHVVAAWITDRNGNAEAGSVMDWDRSQSIRDRDFFTVHQTAEVGTYISGAFTSRVTRRSSFAVSRRKTAPDGAFDGTLHLSLSPEYFATFFKEAAPEIPNTALMILDDGRILSRSNWRGELPPLPSDSPLMQTIAAGSESGVQIFRSPLDGHDRLVAYRKVMGYPVYVSFGLELAAIHRQWIQNVTHYGLLALAAALALLLVSALAIRRARAEQEALVQLREQTDQRLKAEQRLFRAEKMQSIGQLTGGIAHDFNNLLAIVLGNISIVRRRIKTDTEVLPFLDRAMRGAERGASLTQRLLAFARQQDLSPSDVEIPTVVDSVQDLLRRSLGPDIRIEADFPPRLAPAKVDQHQLELALVNLIVNARDAMPQGGTVTIRGTEVRADPGDAELRSGDYIRVSVVDTGIGMDAQTLAKATEPFFTTKGVGKGTGLGLSMVQGLAQQSGGAFRIASQPGSGTTAELWLPKGEVAPETQRAEAVTKTGVARSAPPATILVVDDDELVLASTAEMLREDGHIAVEASSGAAALSILDKQGVDLVITDQLMPYMTGLQLAERIRAQRPSMPIVLASGHAELPDHTLELPRLRKPFRQSELADAVHSALSRSNDVRVLAG
jgi:signal transduction histidine kinase